jgi:hypothetical protein
MVRTRARNSERGAIAVVAAVMLVIVGAFLAFSLNVGNVMHTRGELQNAVDSAALAGAASFDGTAAGLTTVTNTAYAFATSHYVETDRIALAAGSDIQAGIWSFSNAVFTPSSDLTQVNALRVIAGRDGTGSHNAPLPVFFGAFLGGQTSVNLHATAVAAGGGPASGCSIPIVLAACSVRTSSGDLNCAQQLIFGNANLDNVGWSNLTPGASSVSTSQIISVLNGTATAPGCSTDPATGLPCCSLNIGDQLAVGNGNNLTNQVQNAFYNPTNGPTGGFVCSGNNGKNSTCPTLTVPVVNVPCSGGNPAFTGMNPIAGFATFTIGQVSSKNREIDLTMLCQQSSTAPAGGPSFGTSGRPRLVQ